MAVIQQQDIRGYTVETEIALHTFYRRMYSGDQRRINFNRLGSLTNLVELYPQWEDVYQYRLWHQTHIYDKILEP